MLIGEETHQRPSAATCSELAKDPIGMAPHGRRFDSELGGDLYGVVAFTHQPKHFELTDGERARRRAITSPKRIETGTDALSTQRVAPLLQQMDKQRLARTRQPDMREAELQGVHRAAAGVSVHLGRTRGCAVPGRGKPGASRRTSESAVSSSAVHQPIALPADDVVRARAPDGSSRATGFDHRPILIDD